MRYKDNLLILHIGSTFLYIFCKVKGFCLMECYGSVYK